MPPAQRGGALLGLQPLPLPGHALLALPQPLQAALVLLQLLLQLQALAAQPLRLLETALPTPTLRTFPLPLGAGTRTQRQVTRYACRPFKIHAQKGGRSPAIFATTLRQLFGGSSRNA